MADPPGPARGRPAGGKQRRGILGRRARSDGYPAAATTTAAAGGAGGMQSEDDEPATDTGSLPGRGAAAAQRSKSKASLAASSSAPAAPSADAASSSGAPTARSESAGTGRTTAGSIDSVARPPTLRTSGAPSGSGESLPGHGGGGGGGVSRLRSALGTIRAFRRTGGGAVAEASAGARSTPTAAAGAAARRTSLNAAGRRASEPVMGVGTAMGTVRTLRPIMEDGDAEGALGGGPLSPVPPTAGGGGGAAAVLPLRMALADLVTDPVDELAMAEGEPETANTRLAPFVAFTAVPETLAPPTGGPAALEAGQHATLPLKSPRAGDAEGPAAGAAAGGGGEEDDDDDDDEGMYVTRPQGREVVSRRTPVLTRRARNTRRSQRGWAG